MYKLIARSFSLFQMFVLLFFVCFFLFFFSIYYLQFPNSSRWENTDLHSSVTMFAWDLLSGFSTMNHSLLHTRCLNSGENINNGPRICSTLDIWTPETISMIDSGFALQWKSEHQRQWTLLHFEDFQNRNQASIPVVVQTKHGSHESLRVSPCLAGPQQNSIDSKS